MIWWLDLTEMELICRISIMIMTSKIDGHMSNTLTDGEEELTWLMLPVMKVKTMLTTWWRLKKKKTVNAVLPDMIKKCVPVETDDTVYITPLPNCYELLLLSGMREITSFLKYASFCMVFFCHGNVTIACTQENQENVSLCVKTDTCMSSLAMHGGCEVRRIQLCFFHYKEHILHQPKQKGPRV